MSLYVLRRPSPLDRLLAGYKSSGRRSVEMLDRSLKGIAIDVESFEKKGSSLRGFKMKSGHLTRIIIFDSNLLDESTALPSAGQVPPQMKAALQQAREEGEKLLKARGESR